MTDQAVYYNTEQQVVPLTVSFSAVPSAVVLAVTDPYGISTVFTYSFPGTDPNEVVSDGGGDFHVWLTPFSGTSPFSTAGPSGLWTFTWTGVGNLLQNGVEVDAGTFRVLSYADTGLGMTRWYCAKEELKSRLQIDPDDNSDDYEIQLTMQTVTDWITQYCGRHFYRVTESRTYEPASVWTLHIDDIVEVTSVDLDYDGDGVYEVHWAEDVNYQLLRYMSSYNSSDLGVARPRNYLQVTTGSPGNPVGGSWLPWIIPFTRRDRVKVTGTWGWPDVPPNVTMAALYLSAEVFKSKDSPFGVAGISDLGIVKIQASPWVVELLRPYKNARKTVGCL